MIQNVPRERLCRQRHAVREQVVATIPQERENTLLEVALMHHTVGDIEVELRALVWGEGLGWYRQSTLTLDQTTARKLLGALSTVRHRLEPSGAARNEDQDETKVILFPDSRRVATEADEPTELPA